MVILAVYICFFENLGVVEKFWENQRIVRKIMRNENLQDFRESLERFWKYYKRTLAKILKKLARNFEKNEENFEQKILMVKFVKFDIDFGEIISDFWKAEEWILQELSRGFWESYVEFSIKF